MDLKVIQNFTDTFAFYFLLISMLTYWFNLTFSIKDNRFIFLSSATTLITNVLITFTLTERWIEFGYFPISNLYESLLFLCWCILTLILILEWQTKSRLIGSVLTPVGVFILAFSSLFLPKDMQSPLPLVPALKSNWLMMHVTVMMLSYATLITGSLLSIIFLFSSFGKAKSNTSMPLDTPVVSTNFDTTETPLQTNYLGTLIKDKSSFLSTLDNLSYRIIGLGFPLLTIGIISGGVWANEAWGSYWSWDPKETWALITWLVFAAYLHTRIIKSWEGKRPAIVASVGFVVVWICYLGVNFFGKGLHSYGWLS